jgi:4-carboxymuconolactone decarboxylase
MSRLPYLQRDDLDDAGRAVWDALATTRGRSIVNDAGGLVGPFNAWVHAPGVGARLSELGATLRFETSLDRRLLELAIIVVAAHWKAEFEWWAHARMAREHGVDDVIVAAIGRGETPSFKSDDEAVVYAFARRLVVAGVVDDATFASAVKGLGHQGVVELVSLCGYYTLVSFTLNAFAVPLPPGVGPAWPTSADKAQIRSLSSDG